MQESTIALRGTKLHMRRAGSGPPLLFLHGAQGLAGWPRALEILARDFTVLAPDHPSFGASDMPPWLERIEDLAYFYLDLLEAEGLSGVHIVGQSIGGWIGLEMAVRNTARLKSLTLVASAGLRVKGVPRADMFIVRPEELAALLFVDRALADETARDYADPAQAELHIRNRVAAARMAWNPRLCNPALAKWLHRVNVPTHLLWGDSDRIIPPAHAEAFKELISGSKVTILPSCGHVPHVERPDQFASAVAGFIRQEAS